MYQVYDDGTSLYTSPDGDVSAANANGQLVSSWDAQSDSMNYTPAYYTDNAEAARLQQFAPDRMSTRPWYEQVAQYGIMRAIDTHYGTNTKPNQVPRGSLAPTFAGQNGRTYTQGAVNQTQEQMSNNMLPLLMIAVVALAVMA